MKINVAMVEKTISCLPFIKSFRNIKNSELFISGKISVFFEGMDHELDFEFIIFPAYPLKRYDSESIKFVNKDLIRFNHVMDDGSICIHTTHDINPKKKLISDFSSLKGWIEKYYINKDEDINYEHIIVPENLCNSCYYSYIFTEVEHQFSKNERGYVDITSLGSSKLKGKEIKNYLLQSFHINEKKAYCDWSETYLNAPQSHRGFYLFMENHPTVNERFIYTNWDELKDDVPNVFIDILYKFEKANKKKFKGDLVPIFFGYKTLNSNIHWQAAILEIGKFPIHGIPERVDGVKTGNWIGEFVSEEINWAITRDASYRFFFGRGSLHHKLADSKILIIGIGAVGSMVAKALTKGGCRQIDLADYDIKNPENVCRSEYVFATGVGDKIEDLPGVLSTDSPFLNISIFNKQCFEDFIKGFYDRDPEVQSRLISILNSYDFVFDCTTDDDLMFVLNSLKLNANKLINISITNHAKHLICAFYPNIYHFVRTQIDEILDHDPVDLYEPLGCWSPTFKASYTDINLLVQYAIKQIEYKYETDREPNNFVLSIQNENNFGVFLKEF